MTKKKKVVKNVSKDSHDEKKAKKDKDINSKEAINIKQTPEILPATTGEDPGISVLPGDEISTETEPDEIEEATQKLLDPKLIQSTIESIFLMAAGSWGEHWKLKDFEAANLSEALTNYLNVVLPELLKEQPELFALGITSVLILGPRLAKNVKHKKSEQDKGNTPISDHTDTDEIETTRKADGRPLPSLPKK